MGRPQADPVDPFLFREAMASFPTGVTIVTTVDHDGQPHGFTASAFCSLSADPPLVLVCLAKSADCHSAFWQSDKWATHILHSRHQELAVRFATKGADKFGDEPPHFFPNAHGVPVLRDAAIILECETHARYDGGDHTILVGRIAHLEVSHQHPLLYVKRTFRQLFPEA